MGQHVDFYFSPISPWTHLGLARFRDMVRRHGATVAVKPVDFGKIFPVSGGVPVKQRPPQRQAYRMAELKRWRAFLGIPINLEPKFFPVSGDPAARVIIAATGAGVDRQLDLAAAFLRGCWEGELNIADDATIRSIIDGVGLDGTRLVQEAAQPIIQGTYDAFTAEAIERQVFGAPTFVIDGEVFWGQDRLDFVERALARSA
ncbi:MAG: 2-hydroxychromene-2-carboxylate isomerase [Burkholderiales bacterium]|nr:2-hydroxychromene-2-carboxylate isomerase [Burkholderiales bacterium]